jgi:hypothetical protein
MADTRRVMPEKIQSFQRLRRRLFSCAAFASALCALAAVAYFHFQPVSASSVQRGDRIDFSSLVTVAPIEEYSQWQVQGLSSSLKDDRMPNDLPRLSLVTTGGRKTDLQNRIAGTVPEVTVLVAKHAAKLRRHIEQALQPEVTDAKMANVTTGAPAITNTQAADSSASLRPAESLVSRVSDRVNNTVSSGTASGGRGALSGLTR